MFGGVAFLLYGKRMFCGIVRNELMLRVGPEGYESALARAHVRPMDFTGRPMTGYVFVGAPACRTAAAVARWLELGLAYVASLPAAGASRPRRKQRAPSRVERR